MSFVDAMCRENLELFHASTMLVPIDSFHMMLNSLEAVEDVVKCLKPVEALQCMSCSTETFKLQVRQSWKTERPRPELQC